MLPDAGAKAASRSTSASSCTSNRDKATAPAAASEQGSQEDVVAASEQGSQEDVVAYTCSQPNVSSPVPVRNTFVDVVLSRNSSLDGFFEKRQVRSYPGSEAPDLPSDMPATPPPEDRASLLIGSTLGGWQEFWSPAQVEPPYQQQDFRFQHQQQFQPQLQQQFERQEPYLAQTTWLQPVPPPPLLPPFLPFVEEPQLGSAELPTRGSAGHGTGACKPCAFFHTKGCESGVDCSFCHLCMQGEKIRRRKERMFQRKTAPTNQQHTMAQATSWNCSGVGMYAPDATAFLRPR